MVDRIGDRRHAAARDAEIGGKIVDDAFGHGDDMRGARIDEANHRLGGNGTAKMGAGVHPFADQPRPAASRHRPGVGDIGAGQKAERRIGLEPSGERAQPGQARQQFMPRVELMGRDPFGDVIGARFVVEQREMDVVARAPRLRPAEQGRQHALGAAARKRVDREQYPLSVQHDSSLKLVRNAPWKNPYHAELLQCTQARPLHRPRGAFGRFERVSRRDGSITGDTDERLRR